MKYHHSTFNQRVQVLVSVEVLTGAMCGCVSKYKVQESKSVPVSHTVHREGNVRWTKVRSSLGLVRRVVYEDGVRLGGYRLCVSFRGRHYVSSYQVNNSRMRHSP